MLPIFLPLDIKYSVWYSINIHNTERMGRMVLYYGLNHTKIPWVKNPDGTQGYTLSPITGCLHGCKYCYARQLANTRLRKSYLSNRIIAPTCGDKQLALDDPFYPRIWRDRIETIYHLRSRKKPIGIFICDMGELFADWVPSMWTEEVLQAIQSCPQHRFYLLTKQPDQLRYFKFPDNVWLGVSASTMVDLVRSGKFLSNIKATIKYLSIEPMLDYSCIPGILPHLLKHWGIGWIIIGASTGTFSSLEKTYHEYNSLTHVFNGHRMSLQPPLCWVEKLVEIASSVKVPIFLKNNLMPLMEKEGITKQDNWTGLRQEMPIPVRRDVEG